MLEKTNKGEGCFEWRSLRSTGMNRSDTIRAHGDARQACMTGLIPAQPSFLLAPVFPGSHPLRVYAGPSYGHGSTLTCWRLDSNQRPKSLPTELHAIKLERAVGFEPTTFTLEG